MPTIAVDARAMFAAHPRGIGKTLAQLYRRLSTLEPDWRFLFYVEPHQRALAPFPLSGTNATVRAVASPGSRWHTWLNLRLPVAAWLDRADVLHCPAQYGPHFSPVPTVVTVHDLIPLRIDDGWSERARRRLERNLRRSLTHAARIVAISEHTRADLLECFGAQHADRIEVVPWAAEFAAPAAGVEAPRLAEVRATYGIGTAPFFFALGGEAPRKNTPRLLEAFRDFAAADDAWHLVVVGGQTQAVSAWRRQIAEYPCAARVHLHGYVPDADMVPLYAAAGAFVFPSYYEGFGLPVLDALASACPLLAADRTSIPEIAREAAVYFDPHDTAALAAAMRRVAGDAGLRRELASAGRARAALYTWDETALRMRDVLRAVVGGRA